MMATDQPTPVQKPLYGVHPMYMNYLPPARLGAVGMATGVFWLNSNAMAATINDNDITLKSTGGLVDLFVMLGPQPEDVVQQVRGWWLAQ